MDDIVFACQNIFTSADRREWAACQRSFEPRVYVDYSSLSGRPAAEFDAPALIETWKDFLPRFDWTLHFLDNFETDIYGERAGARCYGHALHGKSGAPGGDVWEVFGTYDFELVRRGDGWKVAKLVYNHRHAAGNLELPALVTKEN